MPPDELMWSWVKAYGHIFKFVSADGEMFFFRRLTRREYRLLLTISDDVAREEEACAAAVLWPCNVFSKDPSKVSDSYCIPDDSPAGLAEGLCREILRASGCAEHMRPRFEQYTNTIDTDLEAQMESVVDHVFAGGGDFHRYQEWSHDQFYDAYARAAWILKKVMQVELKPAEQDAPGERRRRRPRPLDESTGVEPNDPIASLPSQEFGGERMALRPIAEVASKAARAQRLAALREATTKKKTP